MTDPTTTVALVRDRTRTRIEPIGLRSDKEVPAFLRSYPPTYFLAGTGGFSGTGDLIGDDGAVRATGQEASALGTVMLGIGDGRLIGIVSPNDRTAPAVWLNVPLASSTVKTEGTTGLFKKRPQRIFVSAADDSWELMLGNVSSFNRERGYRQASKEAELVAALRH